MRKISIVTGTRAEYGLLYWIIKGVHEYSDPLDTFMEYTFDHPDILDKTG